MNQPAGVFLITLQAVEPPATAPLTVLAFALAATVDEATATAKAELASFGWIEIQALRTGELMDEAALPADFRDAVANARRYGCGLIIYDEP